VNCEKFNKAKCKVLRLGRCPGFGQDGVNFHWNPGRDTAGRADPTWPNRARYSIPCAVTLGSGWGEQRGGNSLAPGERGRRSGPGEWLSGSCGLCCAFLLIRIVVVPVPFVCCSVKLPLSTPTSFLPVSFHSPPHPGRGRASRVALLLPAAAKPEQSGQSQTQVQAGRRVAREQP